MKSDKKKKSARKIAVCVLDKISADFSKGDYSEYLREFITQTEEKARLTDIVSGSVRCRITIDYLIERISARPVKRIQKKILNVLRVGMYELVYNSKTAAYAIVDQAVNTAKHRTGKKQAGFVNAVLRETLRNIKERNQKLTAKPDSAIIPVSSDFGCEFKTKILPDYKKHKSDFLQLGFSLPGFLVDKWLSRFESGQVWQLCTASIRKPSIYLRVNPLKVSRTEFCKKITEEGIETEPVGKGNMVKVASPSDVTDIYGYRKGFFSVQDLTAEAVAGFMDIKKHTKVLDFCSAPGGKSCGIAELAGDELEITATDIEPSRLRQVDENTERLGLKSIKTVDYKKFIADESCRGSFDYVLADVPCSNSGVLARRTQVRHRINENSVKKLCKKQLEILRTTSGFVKTGGVICYSTCSILKEENEEVVQAFLKQNPDHRILKQKLTLPSAKKTFDRDGGYICLLKNYINLS
jgi:16S rRNA (cytosine967-C5)-methyltransferase